MATDGFFPWVSNKFSLCPDDLEPTGSPFAKLATKESPLIRPARPIGSSPRLFSDRTARLQMFSLGSLQDGCATGRKLRKCSIRCSGLILLFISHKCFCYYVFFGEQTVSPSSECSAYFNLYINKTNPFPFLVFLRPQMGQDLVECGWRDEVKELVALISKPHFKVRRSLQTELHHTFLKRITAVATYF